MKAIIELEFNDKHVYGKDGKQELPNDEYRYLEGTVTDVVYDAFGSTLHEATLELGIHMDIHNVTDENSNKFSYILSTSHPANVSIAAFDMFDKEVKSLMGQFGGFFENYDLRRHAWKEYNDGTEDAECIHAYETVQFLAMGSEIREIQTCIKCKESIAKLVKLV